MHSKSDRNNNNNNNTWDSVYGAVIMTQVIARVHPVHLMNAGEQCHLLLLSPKADTHLTIPWRVKG